MLLRQFDRLSANDRGQPWLPCPPDVWCADYRAQWPSSVVNHFVRLLYFPFRGGLVLDSSVLSFFCVYYQDGNSMARACGGGYGDGVTCIPGCAPVDKQCLTKNCTCWDCSFPPEHLKDVRAWPAPRVWLALA